MFPQNKIAHLKRCSISITSVFLLHILSLEQQENKQAGGSPGVRLAADLCFGVQACSRQEAIS
jgi:hypothetical protein